MNERTEAASGKRKRLIIIAVVTGLMITCCCSCSGSKVAQAESAVAEGRYDEAIVLYEQVLVEHPDSEEAIQAPEAITDVMIARTGALYTAEEWKKCGRSYLEVADRIGDLGEAMTRVREATGTNAHHAGLYVAIMDEGATDENFDFAVDWLETMGLSADEGPRTAITEWLCGHRDEFPAYQVCRGITTETASRPIEDAMAAFQEAEAACERVGMLADVCDGEVAEELVALVRSPALAELRTGIDARQNEWRTLIENQAEAWLEEAAEAGRECEDASRQLSKAKRILNKLIPQELAGWTSDYQMRDARQRVSTAEANLAQARRSMPTEDEIPTEWPSDIKASTTEALSSLQPSCGGD